MGGNASRTPVMVSENNPDPQALRDYSAAGHTNANQLVGSYVGGTSNGFANFNSEGRPIDSIVQEYNTWLATIQKSNKEYGSYLSKVSGQSGRDATIIGGTENNVNKKGAIIGGPNGF